MIRRIELNKSEANELRKYTLFTQLYFYSGQKNIDFIFLKVVSEIEEKVLFQK